MKTETCDIGLIGLPCMGQNLVLNMNDHGYRVAVFNRTVSKVDDFLNDEAKGTKVVGAHSIPELIQALKKPRRVMLMVEAGVSGGEEGARFGPSIMPGGNPAAWPHVKEIFQAIAAKVEDGTPCCDWVGEDGAGHYVKMVHNGIEYGDMQLICEAYDLLKRGLELTPDELHEVFTDWNKGELDSYLMEISSQIFTKRDDDGAPLIDKILDTAGQKGTGKWTGISALDLGMPVTLIGEAVFARCLSALKDERVDASKVLTGPERPIEQNRNAFIEDVRR